MSRSNAAGATVGAAAGGLTGTFIAAGASREDAHSYAQGCSRGGTGVTVKADGKHVAATEQILARRAVNSAERGKSYRDVGWHEFNPAAILSARSETSVSSLRVAAMVHPSSRIFSSMR